MLRIFWILPLLGLFSSLSHGKSFSVELRAAQSDQPYLQKSAERKIVANKKICTPNSLAWPSGRWQCRPDQRLQKCVRRFSCVPSKGKINRPRALSVIDKSLKGMKQNKYPYKIQISKESDRVVRKSIDPIVSHSKKRSPKIGKKQEIEKEATTNLFKANMGVSRVSDDAKSNILTIDFAWTPTLSFSEQLALRLNLGGHMSEQVVDTSTEEVTETFIVLDTAILGVYSGKSFFGEVGVGYQLWFNEAGDKTPTLIAGGGYQLAEKFWLVNRIYIDYVHTLDDYGTREIRLGLGFDF